MSFPLYPHNGQGFPHCSFPSYFRTDIPCSQHRGKPFLTGVRTGLQPRKTGLGYALITDTAHGWQGSYDEVSEGTRRIAMQLEVLPLPLRCRQIL